MVALLAMVIATFSTGIDSQCFRFKKDVCSEGEEEDGVPYGCGFFHFVFATSVFTCIIFSFYVNYSHPRRSVKISKRPLWSGRVSE